MADSDITEIVTRVREGTYEVNSCEVARAIVERLARDRLWFFADNGRPAADSTYGPAEDEVK